jgi:hypothetical protein
MSSEHLLAILLQVFEHRHCFSGIDGERGCKNGSLRKRAPARVEYRFAICPPFVAPLDAAGVDVQLMSGNRMMESGFWSGK